MKVKYYDLENKRVFITGGGSGIGASIVEHFCEQGSEVYFIDINVSESEKLIEEIKNKKYSIPTFIQCDLLNIKQLQKTIADIIDQKGPIDILINNAANDTRHKIDDVTEEYWNERMNVNLRHFFFTVQSVKKSMIDNGGGAIINMGSTSWMIVQGGMAAYTAAKSVPQCLRSYQLVKFVLSVSCCHLFGLCRSIRIWWQFRPMPRGNAYFFYASLCAKPKPIFVIMAPTMFSTEKSTLLRWHHPATGQSGLIWCNSPRSFVNATGQQSANPITCSFSITRISPVLISSRH